MNLNSIADDIYRATITPRPANFKTTREKQIEFMLKMYAQGYRMKDIATVFDTKRSVIAKVIHGRRQGMRIQVRKR